MANRNDINNESLMKMTYDNANYMSYILGYLKAYAHAGMDLNAMFAEFDDMEMTEDQKKLYLNIKSSYEEIVKNMRDNYLPR